MRVQPNHSSEPLVSMPIAPPTSGPRPRWLSIKSALFTFLVLPLLSIVYWVINSQGLRLSLPVFGVKLHKLPLPGFSYLRRWVNYRDIDLAHVFALLLLFFVWLAMTKVIRMVFYGFQPPRLANPDVYVKVFSIIMAALLLTDVLMFYRGLVDQSWFGGGGITEVTATAGYTALLWFCAFIHVGLRED